MKRGGASAGISAEAPDRDDAVVAFVTEAAGLAIEGTYLPDAAKGVSEADLAPLREADPRDASRFAGESPTFADRCDALSIAVCAESTVGGLEGRTVTIQAAGPVADALANVLTSRGAKVIDDAGAEVVFVGSKMGVVDHHAAEEFTSAAAVVPCGRLPLTAKALAVLRRANVAAPADFVALAGSTIAAWGSTDRSEADIEAEITERIGAMSAEFASHADGPLLAACYQAEEFLGTWQDTLPFGRPLAP